MKIFLAILFVILELPFIIKLKQAQYDIIRQTAIILIMLIIALIIFGIFMIV